MEAVVVVIPTSIPSPTRTQKPNDDGSKFFYFLKLLGPDERQSKSQEENLVGTDVWGEFDNLNDELESYHSKALSKIQSEAPTPIMQHEAFNEVHDESSDVELHQYGSSGVYSKSEDYPAP